MKYFKKKPRLKFTLKKKNFVLYNRNSMNKITLYFGYTYNYGKNVDDTKYYTILATLASLRQHHNLTDFITN